MADPLSITASVIGVLAAASRVTTALSKLNDAQPGAEDVIDELSDIRIFMGELKTFLQQGALSSVAIDCMGNIISSIASRYRSFRSWWVGYNQVQL